MEGLLVPRPPSRTGVRTSLQSTAQDDIKLRFSLSPIKRLILTLERLLTAVSAGHAKDGVHSSRVTNRNATRCEYSGIWPSYISLKRCEL